MASPLRRNPIRLALAAMLALLGCGGGSDLGDFTPPPPPPFAVSGTLYSIVELLRVPLAGGEVCLFPDLEPCATTAADGTFTLDGYPPVTDAGLLFRAPGHLALLLPIPALPSDTGAEFIASLLALPTFTTLLGDADAALIIGLEGGVYPSSDTGYIEFSVVDLSRGLPLEGVSVSADVPVGAGPVYLDELGLPDPTLTATSPLGLGALLNVPPGEAELTFQRDGYSCSTPGGFALGWVGTAEGFIARTIAPVAVGANTRIFATCCPNDRLAGGGQFCESEPVP